jgi:hypothetical protein
MGQVITPKITTVNFVRKMLSAEIDFAIRDLEANASTKQLFTTMTPNGTCCNGDSSTDPINPIYVRSTTCWARKIDTSPISVWNNGGGYAAPENAGGTGGVGILVSPRHILFGSHFYIRNGKKLIFVDMNNNVYVRTLSTSSPTATDVRVGLLDSDLPSSVSFCQVATYDLVQYLDSIPIFTSDIDRNALVRQFANGGTNGFSFPSAYYYTYWNSQRLKFYEDTIGGESNNPAAIVYKNKMILLFMLYQAGTIGGYPFISGINISTQISSINSVMATLGGGYSLSQFTLSNLLADFANDNVVLFPNPAISVKKTTGVGKINIRKI